jgi:dipeptide transport system substrate-binding protein
MQRFLTALGLGLCVAAGPAFAAKTLVFCSEGSPEGFNPQFYTAGTTFDASSRAVFDGLVKFERGTTNSGPGLAESWEISEDGLQYTFKLRKGVKFHTTADFTPSRDFNADDVIFSSTTTEGRSSLSQSVRRCLRIFQFNEYAGPDQVHRKGG